jgi:DNA-binding GntR family transcriptional regulator
MPDDAKIALVEAVRTAIVQGEYAPRQRLIETDLCERFGTSRFIARSALQELSAQGLVEFQRNKGARVRDVSLTEAIEITEVRQLLEGLVAARAAERVGKAAAARLRAIVADMRTAVTSSELVRYGDLNAALHAVLRDIAGHAVASRVLSQLRDQTVRHQFSLSLMPGRPAVSLPQHEAIVAAVTARDPAAAEIAMRAHLQSVIDALRTLQAEPALHAQAVRPPLPAQPATTAPSAQPITPVPSGQPARRARSVQPTVKALPERAAMRTPTEP